MGDTVKDKFDSIRFWGLFQSWILGEAIAPSAAWLQPMGVYCIVGFTSTQRLIK